MNHLVHHEQNSRRTDHYYLETPKTNVTYRTKLIKAYVPTSDLTCIAPKLTLLV